jgi:hypothetical protein
MPIKPSVLDLSRGDESAYTVPGRCTNCGWSGPVKVARGVEAPRIGFGRGRHSGGAADCQYCGCRTITTEAKS